MAHDRGPPGEAGEAVAKLIRILGWAIARRRTASTCRREAAKRLTAAGAGPAQDEPPKRETPATEAASGGRDVRPQVRDLAGDGGDLFTVDWDAVITDRRTPRPRRPS